MSGVTLVKERCAREGRGGMRGCLTERQIDEERRDGRFGADILDSLGCFPPEQKVTLLPGGGKKEIAGDGIPPI